MIPRSSRVQCERSTIFLSRTHPPLPVAGRNSVTSFSLSFAHLLIASTDETGKRSSVADTIEAHDGVVDDYFGDGIKANFGVPIPRLTEAERATDAANSVRCALVMAEGLQALNARYRARGLPECGMRIGIHTGPVVAGSLGAAGRLKYTVVGDVVVTAQRLEATAAVEHDFTRYPCRVLASEETCGRLTADFETESFGEIELKGKGTRVAVRKVLGLRSQGVASREPAS